MMGLRIGRDPRVVVTTTPRPTRIVRDLIAAPTTVVTRGSTYDNVDHLAPAFIDKIIERYQGTRMGRQELYGEVLLDNPNALFRRDWIDDTRVRSHPQLRKVVVGVDPSGGEGVDHDEQGIVVAGTDSDGHDGYVLADYTCKLGPAGWARRAVTAYHEYQADYVVAEANFGGDMVRHTLKMEDPDVPVRLVSASRGKAVRAQPIADLYEQRRIHHLGSLPLLEDELVEWNPDGTGPSPNRLDALVWAFSELMVTARTPMARVI
jgi:phage terminase large subunit-like protein